MEEAGVEVCNWLRATANKPAVVPHRSKQPTLDSDLRIPAVVPLDADLEARADLGRHTTTALVLALIRTTPQPQAWICPPRLSHRARTRTGCRSPSLRRQDANACYPLLRARTPPTQPTPSSLLTLTRTRCESPAAPPPPTATHPTLRTPCLPAPEGTAAPGQHTGPGHPHDTSPQARPTLPPTPIPEPRPRLHNFGSQAAPPAARNAHTRSRAPAEALCRQTPRPPAPPSPGPSLPRYAPRPPPPRIALQQVRCRARRGVCVRQEPRRQRCARDTGERAATLPPAFTWYSDSDAGIRNASARAAVGRGLRAGARVAARREAAERRHPCCSPR